MSRCPQRSKPVLWQSKVLLDWSLAGRRHAVDQLSWTLSLNLSAPQLSYLKSSTSAPGFTGFQDHCPPVSVSLDSPSYLPLSSPFPDFPTGYMGFRVTLFFQATLQDPKGAWWNILLGSCSSPSRHGAPSPVFNVKI